jgi:hypothetical protein
VVSCPLEGVKRTFQRAYDADVNGDPPMIRRLIIATTLLVAPTVLLAQRGGRTQADKRTELMDKSEIPKGVDIRVRDLEDQSPLHLLIDKRKDLSLTDAQLSQLKDAEEKLKEKNAPLYKSADSLIRATRLTSSSSDAEKSRAQSARGTLMELVKTLNESYDGARKDAIALLDAQQQPKANELLDKQKEESEKFLRDRIRRS